MTVSGAEVVTTRFALENARGRGVLEVARLRRFEVVLGAPVRADSLAVLAPGGETLEVVVASPFAELRMERVPLEGGRSGVCRVDERARTLVLHRGDEEVERHPLSLQGDDVAVLLL